MDNCSNFHSRPGPPTNNPTRQRRNNPSRRPTTTTTTTVPERRTFGRSSSSAVSARSIAARSTSSSRGSTRTHRRRSAGAAGIPTAGSIGMGGSSSSRSTSSAHTRNRYNRGNNAPHRFRRPMSSTASTTTAAATAATVPPPAPSSSHLVCALGENLARETCVVSLDLAAPFVVQVTKQGNGQSYAETIAYLALLQPDEVLLNEGRYHSPLARKVLQHFDTQRRSRRSSTRRNEGGAADDGTSAAIGGEPHDDEDATVVKFLSRSYFDQTKGAELLRRVARQDTYDIALVEEYILLSSTHALLHYTQLTLGAVAFTPHSVDVRVQYGGAQNHRMEIDRATLLQLELLANNSSRSSAKASRNNKHSLIATMDCTKTQVGHRLLRTTLMAPPCRLDTITARLDLVETFLHQEELFYATLQQLHNLTSLDNMLTNIVVIPPRRPRQRHKPQQQPRRQTSSSRSLGGGSVYTSTTTRTSTTTMGRSTNGMLVLGKSNAAQARVASKGISALVCIKSTLACIPILAALLQHQVVRQSEEPNERRHRKKRSRRDHNEENDDDDEDDDDVGRGGMSIATAKTSLLVGLGIGGGNSSSSSSSATSRSSNQQLLRAIIFALTQPDLVIVREAIDNAFTESTTYKKNANAMKHQECFALKSSEGNGLMDILRKAFLSNVDDIYKNADAYAEVHGIHVAVRFSTARGYYLALPVAMASDLPKEFIQPTKSGKYIHCSTTEVQSLNMRAQDNIQDLLMMTHERIQEVLDVARSKYDALARLSDAVALLDLCHSFADKVTLSKLPWARPSLTDGTGAAVEKNGANNQDEDDDDNNNNAARQSDTTKTPKLEETHAIAICNGRYGIDVDDTLGSTESEWIANDTYADLSKNLTIISGINGSGKSTYLKQIAIVVILGHCGSYVPAEEALIPLTNRLCARMMTADDQENNISSFMLEMKETAFICNNANARSLVLLDELGRATSNEDGVAIAWAVAENLLAKGAMTYFVTHYPQICAMSRVYPANVQNIHLKAAMSTETGNGIIEYSHKIVTGPCTVASSYGVEMATSCGWPSDVVDEARRIESTLKDKLVESKLCNDDSDIDTEIRYKKSLKETSQNLIDYVNNDADGNDLDGLRRKLEEIKVSLLEEVPKAAIMSLLKDDYTTDEELP